MSCHRHDSSQSQLLVQTKLVDGLVHQLANNNFQVLYHPNIRKIYKRCKQKRQGCLNLLAQPNPFLFWLISGADRRGHPHSSHVERWDFHMLLMQFGLSNESLTISKREHKNAWETCPELTSCCGILRKYTTCHAHTQIYSNIYTYMHIQLCNHYTHI